MNAMKNALESAIKNVVKFTFIYYIIYKTMSFLKITDPAKPDLLVKELIITRKHIVQDSISEKVGDITAQQSLSKLVKPVTEKIEAAAKALPTPSNILAIEPPHSTEQDVFSQVPGNAATELGEIAAEYLKRFASKTNDVDTMFGSHGKGGYVLYWR